jgi:alpha-L-fucosidase
MNRWNWSVGWSRRIRMSPFFVGVLAAALVAQRSAAEDARNQTAGGPASEAKNTAARRSFEDARLGLFIHWGIYSLLAKGEWVMDNDKLPIKEYAKLPPRFNPARFDAEAWVKLAKSAGAKYITITSKHHDGFSMFATKLTDYDIVDATPYRTDPMKALAEACRQNHIKIFFYYSLLDWHHPDYFPRGKTGSSAGREDKGDWKRYVSFYQGQIRELCTNYGEIGGIWLDGWWDRPQADWGLAETYRLIHELQPGALIGNNHHVAPLAGEDFQIFEQDLPGDNAAGFNQTAASPSVPLETCLTINDSWGYNARDTNLKSAERIIHALVGAAGRGANLLLNVGPRPDGEISPDAVSRLQELGKWLTAYGESVYSTRRGPFPPQDWGVSTAKGSGQDRRIYLHVIKPNEVNLRLVQPKDRGPIVFDVTTSWVPHLLGKTNRLTLTQTERGLLLDVPADARMPIETIVVLSPQPVGR